MQKIRRLSLYDGKVEEIVGQMGCSYSISSIINGLVVGTVKAPQFQSFFYMRPGEPMRVIPPKCEEELVVEEIQ